MVLGVDEVGRAKLPGNRLLLGVDIDLAFGD